MRPRPRLAQISRVIGIAGAAGSGKSTIVRELAASLPGSTVVHFDNHPVEMPHDLSAWLADGADFDLWKAPDLEAELASAISGDELVLFEAPLGRRHQGSGQFIDFLVFIEVPLEIALARFVRRELSGAGPSILPGYIEAYETLARDVYQEQLKQVMPEADLVVDGRQPIEVNVRLILDVLDQT
jgi:uridine kinase